MKCKNCGEEYDIELFPVCPYCLSENSSEEEQCICKGQGSAEIGISNISESNIFETTKDKNSEQENAFIEGSQDEVEVGEDTQHEEIIDEVPSDISSAESCIVHEDINIVDIPLLSNRSINALNRCGINTLAELKVFALENDIGSIRNVGAKSLEEIEKAVQYNTGGDSCEAEQDKLDMDCKISDIFGEFSPFMNYCNSNDLHVLRQLQDFDIDCLYSIRYLGENKIKAIKERLNKYGLINGETKQTIDCSNRADTSDKNRMFAHINEQLRGLSIDFLKGLGIRERLIGLLKHNGYCLIGDLEGIESETLTAIVSKRNVERFVDIEDQLKASLVEVFEIVLIEASERDDDYLKTLRKASGETLQSIADSYGLTRERIRQNIKKFNSKLDAFMHPIADFFLSEKGYMTVQEILDIYDNDDFDKILIYWCKASDYVNYLDFADVFIPKQEDDEEVTKTLLEFAEGFVGEGINYTEAAEDLETLLIEMGYPYIDSTMFANLLKEHRYYFYGDFVVKGRQSYGFLCSKAIAKHYKRGIKLFDSKELNALRKIVLDEYGINLTDDDRSLSARISDYTILSGRGCVTAEENVHVELSLLEEIKDFIDSSMEAQIYYSEIFVKLEGMITMLSNIDNYHFLHGVLKMYYPDEYDYSKDYLIKKEKNCIRSSISDRIQNYILEKGRKVSRQEIKKEFPGVTDIVLYTAVDSSDALLLWDYSTYYSTEALIITKNDIKHLESTIQELLDKNEGYCSENMLFNIVTKTSPSFVTKNEIETPNNLFFLATKLLRDKFDFKRPHIGYKGSLEGVSVKSVALKKMNYPERLHYSDFQNIACDFQWPKVTAGCVFSDIEQDYYRLSEDEYIKKEAININREVIDDIEEAIRSCMTEDIFTLMNFENWEIFPEIPFEWNSYLLRTIVDNFIPGLRVIDTISKDRRFERGVVIDAGNSTSTYEDLIVQFLSQRGISSLPENEMLSLLVMNNLAYKLIPKDLFTGRRITYKDEMFFVE